MRSCGNHHKKAWFKKLRLQVCCFYCGNEVRLPNRTIDHIKALSLGGANSQANLVMACSACNAVKSRFGLLFLVTTRVRAIRREHVIAQVVERTGLTREELHVLSR